VAREDIKVEHIMILVGKDLVGKFMGKQCIRDLMNDWLQRTWRSVIGYAPIFHVLTHGWFGFTFHSQKDVASILGGKWFWNSSFFMLKPWHPCFDPHLEVTSIVLV